MNPIYCCQKENHGQVLSDFLSDSQQWVGSIHFLAHHFPINFLTYELLYLLFFNIYNYINTKLSFPNKLIKGDINLQCIYLHKSDKAQECTTGVAYYDTTEDDRQNYCQSNDFLQCPRFIATLRAKEADGMLNITRKN